jgi:hypothetical protein
MRHALRAVILADYRVLSVRHGELRPPMLK